MPWLRFLTLDYCLGCADQRMSISPGMHRAEGEGGRLVFLKITMPRGSDVHFHLREFANKTKSVITRLAKLSVVSRQDPPKAARNRLWQARRIAAVPPII